MQKSAKFRILEYSAAFQNCIPTHIQNPDIFARIDKPSVTLEIQNPGLLNMNIYMTIFQQVLINFQSDLALCIVKDMFIALFVMINSCIHIVTYLEFSVALAYSELCHIQNPAIFRASVKTYSSIFRTLCKTCILRTLP